MDDQGRHQRRYVVLAEGEFGEAGSKTAIGVIRYGSDPVVAIIDSTRSGRDASEWLGPGHPIPIVASLEAALERQPTALLIGTAPQGGRIPHDWRATIAAAIRHGLDVVSGLHEFIGDDPEFRALAATHAVQLVDHRRPPDGLDVAVGRDHRPGSRVILTVGTDCAIGKMSVALELRAAAREAGLAAVFVPTGQTGIMIEGWGMAVDRVIADFLNGAAEQLVEQAEAMGDWIFVEGQGSIDHPGYSPVTLGLLHGTRPHAMVLVHQPGRSGHLGWEAASGKASPLESITRNIELYEAMAGVVSPARVVAIALNTGLLTEHDAHAKIQQVADETGLPVDDPYRFGGGPLFGALRSHLETTTGTLDR